MQPYISVETRMEIDDAPWAQSTTSHGWIVGWLEMPVTYPDKGL